MLVRRVQTSQPVFCASWNTGIITIPVATELDLNMGQLRHSSENDFSLSAGAVVVVKAGWYQITAGLRFVSYSGEFRNAIPAVTTEACRIGLKVDGTSVTFFSHTGLMAGTLNADIGRSRQIALSAGSEIRLTARHYFESSRSIVTNTAFLEMVQLAPA